MIQKELIDSMIHKIFPLGYKNDFKLLIKNAIPLVKFIFTSFYYTLVFRDLTFK